MQFRPPIQNLSRYFSRLNGYTFRTQSLTSREHHISSQHPHFWVQLSAESAFPQPDKREKFLRFLQHNNQRVQYHSLCRVVTHSSSCQYKLQVNFSTNPTQKALYDDLPVKSIKFEVNLHFSGLSFIVEVNFWCALKTVVSCDLFITIIRECCSTHYVGLAHTAPRTNTNIRIIFLLTRLLEALYEDVPV